jgi:glycosyltransferase involved in cell wall biosynthesis
MVDVSGGLVARGVAVDLVLGLARGPYLSNVDPAVRIVELGSLSLIPRLRGMVHYLRRERPEALVSALDNINLASVARTLAHTRTRVALSVQNTLSLDLASHGAKGWARRKMMRALYPRADSVFCVSSGVAEDLLATTRCATERVKTIYNPIRTDLIEEWAREAVDHPWFRRPGPPVLLAVGRLSRQKDYPNLLRAFARLRRSRPARLLILGEGEDREALERLAASQSIGRDLAMPGFVKNPFAYMAKASVFVVSSRWEGLCNVLIEALACGATVVSTDCPSGPREILADGRYGLLVPVGDAAALAAALARALDAPQEPALSRSRASDFHADGIFDQYLDLLRLDPHGMAPAARAGTETKAMAEPTCPPAR